MYKQVIIRKATNLDIPAISGLYHELDDAYSQVHKDSKHSSDAALTIDLSCDIQQHVLVGETQTGEIIATLTIIIVPSLFNNGKPWAAVENVVVSQVCRGYGIGALLMDKAEHLCRIHGCSKIILSSNLVRQSAHRFYRRLGWQESHSGYSLEPYNKNSVSP